MNRMTKMPTLLPIVLMLFAAALPVAAGGRSEAAEPRQDRRITVVGEGIVTAPPDRALIQVGAESFAAEVTEATERNRRIMSRVLEGIREAGVEDRNIQTLSYNINFERIYPEPPQPPGPAQSPEGETVRGNYRVHNMLKVTVEELDRLSTVLDAAIAAGANQLWGVQFEVADPAAIEAEARAEAIRDAREKAEQIAERTGLALGPVLRVSEIVGGDPGIPAARMSAAEGYGGAGPVSAGELTFAVRLELIYSGSAAAAGAAAEDAAAPE